MSKPSNNGPEGHGLQVGAGLVQIDNRNSENAVTVEMKETQRESVMRGFDQLALGATFVAAVQSQLLGNITALDQSRWTTQLISCLWVGGLVLDLMGALLSILTSRWLVVLSPDERTQFEEDFGRLVGKKVEGGIRITSDEGRRDEEAGPRTEFGTEKSIGIRTTSPFRMNTIDEPASSKPSTWANWFNAWIIWYHAHSLFSGFSLVVGGAAAMLVGIAVYAWAAQPWAVCGVVTLAYLFTIPWLFGIFLTGSNPVKRKKVIRKLSLKKGDW